MRRKNYLLFFLLLALPALGRAQTAPVSATGLASPKSYMGMVELGYMYGQVHYEYQGSDASTAYPTLQFFNGYRFGRGLAVGATTGFDFYDNVLVTPLALGIRGEVLDTRVSPTYSLDTGYGSTFLSDESDQLQFKGGWMFNPAIGLRVRTGDGSSAFAFNVGYKTQRITKENDWWGTNAKTKINYKRLSLRMGFVF